MSQPGSASKSDVAQHKDRRQAQPGLAEDQGELKRHGQLEEGAGRRNRRQQAQAPMLGHRRINGMERVCRFLREAPALWLEELTLDGPLSNATLDFRASCVE